MKRGRFSGENILGVQKKHGAVVEVDGLFRWNGSSSATFPSWRKRNAGMWASGAKRLRELGAVNARPKRVAADQLRDMPAMREILEQRWQARGEEARRGLSDAGLGSACDAAA